jgi:hypothetical protein
VDRIEDSEIAPLWKEHFPVRHQSAASLTLIFALMLIVAICLVLKDCRKLAAKEKRTENC